MVRWVGLGENGDMNIYKEGRKRKIFGFGMDMDESEKMPSEVPCQEWKCTSGPSSSWIKFSTPSTFEIVSLQNIASLLKWVQIHLKSRFDFCSSGTHTDPFAVSATQTLESCPTQARRSPFPEKLIPCTHPPPPVQEIFFVTTFEFFLINYEIKSIN